VDDSGDQVVVAVDELVPRLGDRTLVIADVRWYLDGRSGRAAYEAGHVPGAVFVDLDRDLSAPDKGGVAGRHPLPTPAAFAQAMGALGIGDGMAVVAYDDTGGMSAARLVWMLRVCGHRAALLDGGIAAWPDPLDTGPGPTRPAALLTVPDQWPRTHVATFDDVAGAAGQAVRPETRAPRTLLDARAPERYRGDVEPVDARPGHIPGARNAPWNANLRTDGRFRPAADLRRHYEALGAGEGTDTIVYCGSGVSACVDLLARAHAGLSGGRLFAPSWSGWSADPTRPAAVGDG
jgi:thiosulfate/3-mercaptopyruvate sulfurtransferase